jgi:hypothetical protein
VRCGKKGMRPNSPTDDGDVFRTVRNRGKEKAATSVPPSLPTSLTFYPAISAPTRFHPGAEGSVISVQGQRSF